MNFIRNTRVSLNIMYFYELLIFLDLLIFNSKKRNYLYYKAI